ncbi:MAG: UDP-N-acetylmuramoyl-tripeptide--D-alanyl-D-alanine ligase [Clostridia bacterium]|nr:UDP-N-acetylmuramoyl-tripeptide--D-alanyl-D-alanine ligase [Clostridia bacterium]
MKDLYVKDIINITNGQLVIGNENELVDNYCTDTRIIKNDDTYLALVGGNFDGNKFWKEALEKGAKIVIIQDINFEKEDLSNYKDRTIIKVENTLQALYKIAEYKRSLYNIPVVAITGSVGKTSTKDIIASVISTKYKTLKTEANHNNNIGLSLTLLNLKDQEAIVLEMGMNHLGEISLLTQIAKPTVAVITNIGTAHIGNLGSRENILKAKLEILEGMENPILVVNNDNDLLHEYCKNNNNIEIYTYGINNESNIMAKNIELHENSSTFTCNCKNENLTITVPVGGEHFVLNAICACKVGELLAIPNEQIKQGIEGFELTNKRMDISKLSNGVTIINDSYNASYESMAASLKYLARLENPRKIAVLGDMFELGEYAIELHKKVGEEVAKNKIDLLICAGENAKYIYESAIKNGLTEENAYYLEDKEEIVKYLNLKMQKGDVILFKASNGMKFFNLVEELKNE